MDQKIKILSIACILFGLGAFVLSERGHFPSPISATKSAPAQAKSESQNLTNPSSIASMALDQQLVEFQKSIQEKRVEVQTTLRDLDRISSDIKEQRETLRNWEKNLRQAEQKSSQYRRGHFRSLIPNPYLDEIQDWNTFEAALAGVGAQIPQNFQKRRTSFSIRPENEFFAATSITPQGFRFAKIMGAAVSLLQISEIQIHYSASQRDFKNQFLLFKKLIPRLTARDVTVTLQEDSQRETGPLGYDFRVISRALPKSVAVAEGDAR